ncbi:hypothetical protein [Pseudarthrobacter albicanus]|uniref:hypothetical protein n=1 Tax=Pseudarthrobacter albicanus TaxID=2823873 RepID=UPI001FEC5200|nr:hypothetical protein [Pseudarthrobacter albicanus]
MSGQQPGPVPETTPDGAAAPAPVTWPVTGPADAPHGAGQPAQAAAPGWGAPAQAAAPDWGGPGRGGPGWGAPPQDLAGPAQGWGGAGAPRRGTTAKPWTLKRGLVVAGAAVVLAAGAGFGVYALTSSSAAADGTAAAGTAPAGPRGQGFAPGGAGGQGSAPGGLAPDGFAGGGMPAQGGAGNFAPGGVGGGLTAAVHAEYVVLQGGAYVVKAEQFGTVTEISPGSVTVKSSDGFTRSYLLGTDVAVGRQQQRRQQGGGSTGSQLGVADIVAGASVRIVAVTNGADYAAESVVVAATAAATGQTN